MWRKFKDTKSTVAIPGCSCSTTLPIISVEVSNSIGCGPYNNIVVRWYPTG